MNFQDLKTTQKGNIGEDIIESHLLSKGLIPYKTNFNGAHPFDFMCATQNKQNMVIVDAKAKPRMDKKFHGYYRTGIDTRHFNEYSHLKKKYGVPIHLYFIDELEGIIYGNSIDALESNMIEKFKNYLNLFSMCDMKLVGRLSHDEIIALKNLSTRKSSYPNPVGWEELTKQ